MHHLLLASDLHRNIFWNHGNGEKQHFGGTKGVHDPVEAIKRPVRRVGNAVCNFKFAEPHFAQKNAGFAALKHKIRTVTFFGNRHF